MSVPVSIVIPVKNEAANLGCCLSTLCHFDDVTVVDSGSTDGTPRVAAEYGRKVVDFAWNGAFPKKRNWALRTCALAHPWVLFLDADERMTPAFEAEAEARLPTTTFDAFRIEYRNHFLGQTLRYGDRMRKVSLLRVGSGEYERVPDAGWTSLDMEVHEQPIVKGRVGRFTARLEHIGKESLQDLDVRHAEYATWEACRFLALSRKDGLTRRQRIKYGLLNCPLFPALYFVASYILKGGVFDGRAGLQFAMNKAAYFRRIQAEIAAFEPRA